jgi:hypothetical protein
MNERLILNTTRTCKYSSSSSSSSSSVTVFNIICIQVVLPKTDILDDANARARPNAPAQTGLARSRLLRSASPATTTNRHHRLTTTSEHAPSVCPWSLENNPNTGSSSPALSCGLRLLHSWTTFFATIALPFYACRTALTALTVTALGVLCTHRLEPSLFHRCFPSHSTEW